MDEKYVDLKSLLNLVELSVDVLGNSCLTSQGFSKETVNKIKKPQVPGAEGRRHK